MGAEPSTDPGGRSRWQSLEFNSTALMAAGLINSALGLVFWALAARFFVEAEVGRAGAVINTAVMLSTLANLSLGALYERFLPLAGRLTGGLLIRGYVVTGTLALTLGAIFIAVGPADDLFGSTTARGCSRCAWPCWPPSRWPIRCSWVCASPGGPRSRTSPSPC